jgi:hypothetical protein
MKTTTLLSLVSVAFISLAQPMWARGGGGGGGHFGGGAPHFSGGAGFHGGMRSFGGPHFYGGGPRFYGGGPRLSSRGPRFSSLGTRQTQIRQRAFAGSNRGFTTPSARSARTFNRQAFSGTNHVFARHAGNWHRDWDRGRMHFWQGRWCRFVNGEWLIFDDGFYPWDYDAYTYDYDYGGDQGYGGYDETADPYSDATVSAVQSQLARQGYYRGVVDGVYGPQTRAALTRYQSNHGLQVNGTLTPATLHALGLS